VGKKLKFIDLDNYYDERKIIDTKPIDKDSFSDRGIFSPRIFGYIENVSIYSCECGEYTGHFYKNFVCPKCNTKVVETNNIKKIGWIKLYNYIIHPIFYNFIVKIIGLSHFKKIIFSYKKLDKHGNIIKLENDPSLNTDKIKEYEAIGLIEFRKNFDEIMKYFYNKRNNVKNIKEYYDLLMKNKEKVFIDKIPVFSTILRPAILKGKKISYDDINNYYNSLVSLSNSLIEYKESEKNKKEDNSKILPILEEVQLNAVKLFNSILSKLKSKKGLIRGNLLGSRVNFSARNVITPKKDCHIDDVIIPYLTFVELYKFQLINLISRMKNISAYDAFKIWRDGKNKFDELIYTSAKELINKTEGGLYILLNRNPSINFGSIFLLRIKDIKKDYNDVTLGLNINILVPMNADFDGDCLNIIVLNNIEWINAFSIFKPSSMLIEPNRGRFNEEFSLKKDQIVGIYSFINEKKDGK